MEEPVAPEQLRRFAALSMIRACDSEDIKAMPEYRAGLDAGVKAGVAVLKADPAAKRMLIEGSVKNAIAPYINACVAELNRRKRQDRLAQQEAAIQQQAERSATEQAENPDVELAALLPGMPEAIEALAGEGLTTVHELLAHAEDQGLVYLTDMGLTLPDAQTMVHALYTAGFNITRLMVAKRATPTNPNAEHTPPEVPQAPPEVSSHEAGDPEPPAHPSPATPEKGVPADSQAKQPAPTPPATEAAPPQPGSQTPEGAGPGEAVPNPTAPQPNPLDNEGLGGLDVKIVKALADNGIANLDQLTSYLAKEGRYTGLKGIGPASAKMLTAFLQSKLAD